mgnify:CR=1 FL=1
MTSTIKGLALPLTPDLVASLWRLLGRLFGRRRRRLIVHPILGTALAFADTVALLAVVRLLLMLQDEADRLTVSVGPVDLDLSFGGLAGVALAALALSFVVRLVEGRVSARNQALAIRRARSLVIDAWFRADWEQLQGERLGRLQQLVGANALRAAVPVQLLSMGSVSAIGLLVFVTIVVATAPVIAAMFALLGAVSGFLLSPLRRRARVLASTHADRLGELQLASTSYAQLNRELHVFGVQGAAAAHLDALSADTADAFGRLKVLQRVVPNVYQQLLLGAVVALVVVGRALDVDAVQFGTAAILAVRSLSYVQQLNSSAQAYTEVRPFLDELLDSVAENQRLARPRGSSVLGPVQSVRLEGVGYRYATGQQALTGLDLELAAGDWLGVIGPSGGGKTTLVNIVAGLLQPTEGALTVNGAPAESYTAESWTGQLGLLSQEPLLLRASVRDNIAFHREVSDAEVREAAARAGIDREVDALPQGFATLIGEGQASLSGGQRQRIALARCLLGSPSCLVLDEPTSALDAENEALVERSLGGIPRQSIVVVASHRPALLGRCTRFVVLDQGRVVAQGDASAVDLAARIPGVGAG